MWLSEIAEIIEAKPPMKAPAFIARALIGEHDVSMMTTIRGSSSAKTELGWSPYQRLPYWTQLMLAVRPVSTG